MSTATEETAAMYRSIQGMMDESRMFNLALLSVCLWEVIATFPVEYTHMWRRKIGVMDTAYFLVRYGVIFQLAIVAYLLYWPHSFESCKRIFRIEFVYPPFMYALGAIIMTMRTYALFNKNRAVVGVLGSLVFIQAAVQFWNPHTGSAVQMPPGINACIGSGFKHYWIYWVCPLIFDSAVLGLTLYKSVRKWKGGARSPLLIVLMRDQVGLYALGSTAAIVNVIHHVLTPESGNKVLMCPLACALQGIAVCRVVLNVRTTAAAGPSIAAPGGDSIIRNVIHLNTLASTANSSRSSRTEKAYNTALTNTMDRPEVLKSVQSV